MSPCIRACLAALAVWCGGCSANVVFVDADGGGSSTSSGDMDDTCKSSICNETVEGCLCSGKCYGEAVEQRCVGDETGFSCECRSGDVLVSTCTQITPACDVATGCCASGWTGQP